MQDFEPANGSLVEDPQPKRPRVKHQVIREHIEIAHRLDVKPGLRGEFSNRPERVGSMISLEGVSSRTTLRPIDDRCMKAIRHQPGDDNRVRPNIRSDEKKLPSRLEDPA